MSGSAKHICFYSKKCKWSERFIRAAQETPFFNEIQFQCIDPNPDGTRPKQPNWLKKVPTLVVSGEREPRTDEDVINWVMERKIQMGGQNQRSTGGGGGQVDRGGGGGSPAPTANGGEPEAWTPNEMSGGFTKAQSQIGSSDDSQQAPVGNFEFLQGANASATRTASDMPGGGLGARGQGGQQKSRKEDLFDKEMEKFLMNRNLGMPPPVMRQ